LACFITGQVTIFDIFLARCLLEVALLTWPPCFVAFRSPCSTAWELLDLPRDLPMFYLGYFYMIWWSVAAGADHRSSLARRTEWADENMATILLLVPVLLGVFFVLAAWLPEEHTWLGAASSRPFQAL